jgi:hypothetical protein
MRLADGRALAASGTPGGRTMRQRIWGRMGVCVAGAMPGLAHAGAPVGAAPTWFTLLPDVLCGVTALALAAGGLWVLYLALVHAEAGDFAFRRHTGGFGGSSTGWQMSKALARLVAGLVLVVLALAVTMARLPLKDEARAETAAGESRTAGAEAKAASAAPVASAAASAK